MKTLLVALSIFASISASYATDFCTPGGPNCLKLEHGIQNSEELVGYEMVINGEELRVARDTDAEFNGDFRLLADGHTVVLRPKHGQDMVLGTGTHANAALVSFLSLDSAVKVQHSFKKGSTWECDGTRDMGFVIWRKYEKFTDTTTFSRDAESVTLTGIRLGKELHHILSVFNCPK